MANDDSGHLSSDDELFVSAATEPMAYTFQSDLSEDEIQLATSTTTQAAPKPISPVAPNADRSTRASLDPFAATPEQSFILPPAPAEDEDPLLLEAAAAALAAVTKVDTSTRPKKRESESLASWRGSVNAQANGVRDHSISGAKRVDIEVVLPYLSPEERAEYTHVEVEPWEEEAKHYDTRKRRNKVSDTGLARYYNTSWVYTKGTKTMTGAILGGKYIWGLPWKTGEKGPAAGETDLSVCTCRVSLSSLGYVSKWHILPSRFRDFILELWSLVGGTQVCGSDRNLVQT